jgi:hypothetical protein
VVYDFLEPEASVCAKPDKSGSLQMLLLPTTSFQGLIRIAVRLCPFCTGDANLIVIRNALSHRCSRVFHINQDPSLSMVGPNPGVSFALPILVPCKESGNTSFAGQDIKRIRFCERKAKRLQSSRNRNASSGSSIFRSCPPLPFRR